MDRPVLCLAVMMLLLPGLMGASLAGPSISVRPSTGPGAGVLLKNLTWTNLTSNLSLSPPHTIGPQMVYDAQTGSIVMFGGYPLPGSTWWFTSHGWNQTAFGTSPRVRSSNLAGFAYDGRSRTAVLFGGNGALANSGASYNYTGAGWNVTNTTTVPPGRSSTMMAYDPVSGSIVLFGGCGPPSRPNTCLLYGDTWTYSNDTWTQLHLNRTPSPRMGGAMAYDAGLHAVVLFGGCTKVRSNVCQRMSDETWEFRSGAWTNLSSPVSPSPRGSCGMAEQPRSSGTGPYGLVLFGGTSVNGTLLGDTWVFHGTSWARLHPTHSPTPRIDFAMAYDPLLSEIVVFSGLRHGQTFGDDTWVLP
ncbi:MAG: kelch repeat-containing protein [Thermoplasmata archaeon]|nr:kelch repeat-containing protein [Thermoplasmata archaeon]